MQYAILFDNVFCEAESSTKYLYNGYQIKETKEREELLILKQSIIDGKSCGVCTNKWTCDEDKFIWNRVNCGIARGYHFVAYKKFDYTLATFVKSAAYTQSNAEQIVKNMLTGLIHLHKKKIFIYNINIDVIVIEKIKRGYKVKFLDFFMSREKNDRLKEPVVPLSGGDFNSADFTASELLEYSKNSGNGAIIDGNAADAFSIFCCIFYVYTLYAPFERNGTSACKNILNRDFEIKFQTIDYIKIVSEYRKPLLADLVKEYLSYDANERPSLYLALMHPFFWDLKKINAYFDKNFATIDNPEKYMNDGNFNYKSYRHLPSILFVQEPKENPKIAMGNNNILFTKFLLKNFKSLLYDVWKKESGHLYASQPKRIKLNTQL